MREAQLRQFAIVAPLDAMIAGWNPVNGALPDELVVQQAYQPRQQGVPITPMIGYYFLGSKPVGWVKRKNVPVVDGSGNPVAPYLNYIEGNRYESRYRITALVPQSPASPDALTEADVLDLARGTLQSLPYITMLAAQNVGVQRVLQIDNAYFEDDRDQNEADPSFDIIFSHRNQLIFDLPLVGGSENAANPDAYPQGGIYPI